MKLQPEFSIVINGQVFNGINDPQSGVDALFPESGEKSLEAVIAEYGDDLDAVMQSATFYRLAIGRNGYAVMEDADQQPFILSPEGETMQPAPGQLEKLRMESEMAALFAYLDDTREKWGEKVVYQWIDEWFIPKSMIEEHRHD